MKRYTQLDALRGLAALEVFFNHVKDVYPRAWYLLDLTPFRIILAGHAAVILFFMLSGFVLTLPFLRQEKNSYPDFLIRRFFRIYIPYFFCVIASFLCFYFFRKANLPGLWEWANTFGLTTFSWNLFFDHLLLFKSFNINAINSVLWTLIIEMRIALVFPFLVIAVKKFSFKVNMVFLVVLCLISIACQYFTVAYTVDYFETIHYVVFFVAGIVLAKYKDEFIPIFRKIKHQKIFFIGSLLLYAYGSMIAYIMQHTNGVSFITQSFSDLSIGISIYYIFLFALSDEKRFSFLERGPLQFLGKISYSFYLYHAIIILSLLNLFYSSLWSLVIIFPVSFVLAICIAFLSHRYIEVPSNKLGRKIAHLLVK